MCCFTEAAPVGLDSSEERVGFRNGLPHVEKGKMIIMMAVLVNAISTC